MTAGRTYLSIGDVLTLLRQEFPDVTISKIRFLESQGLVNPERTPSGYRKFYDHDVERLRWVLRQQREHFLPLKVIKGRLEDGGSSSDSSTRMGNGRRSSDSGSRSVVEAVGSPADRDRGEHASRRSAAVGLDDRDAAGEVGEILDHLPGFDPPAGGESLERHLDQEATARPASRSLYAPPRGVPAQGGPGRGDQHSRPAQTGQAHSGQARQLGTAAAAGTSRGDAQARATRPNTDQPRANQRHASQPQADQPKAGQTTADRTFGGGLKAPWAGSESREQGGLPDTWHSSGPAQSGPAQSGPAQSGLTQSRSPQSGSGAHEATPEAQAAPAKQVEPTRRATDPVREGYGRFTVSEIAAASGLTESTIEQLESYGILTCRMVGGVPHFDESELTIARVAAEFAQFGIEPRHLRLYKHASEREAGFVEQLVLPLLKQRNPEARKRAEEMISDLTRLGENLRSAMVQRSLQDLLGG